MIQISTFVYRLVYCLLAQNRKWAKFHYFWPKNDSEKCLEKLFLKFLHAQSIVWFKDLLHKKGGFWTQTTNSETNWPSLLMEWFQKKKIFMVYVDVIYESLSQKFNPYSILS